MSDLLKIAKNLKQFRHGVADHDRRNPSHKAWGIGLCHFDMQRLDFDDGEELWSGITIHTDEGCSCNFRVLCSGQHDELDEGEAERETEELHLIGALAGEPEPA